LEHQSGVPSVATEETGMSVEYVPVQLFNQVRLKKPCSRESNNINANGNEHENKIMIILVLVVVVVVEIVVIVAAAKIHPEMTRPSRGMIISINRWIFYENLH
jgi:hypothetical protein